MHLNIIYLNQLMIKLEFILDWLVSKVIKHRVPKINLNFYSVSHTHPCVKLSSMDIPKWLEVGLVLHISRVEQNSWGRQMKKTFFRFHYNTFRIKVELQTYSSKRNRKFKVPPIYHKKGKQTCECRKWIKFLQFKSIFQAKNTFLGPDPKWNQFSNNSGALIHTHRPWTCFTIILNRATTKKQNLDFHNLKLDIITYVLGKSL